MDNLYGEWLKQQKRSMRQHHVAGEMLFLDFCGPTIPVIKPDTGEVRQAHMALLRHPLLRGFEVAGAAGPGLAALAEEAAMGAVR